jgi:undecaprenyl-diphosphatase
MNQVMHSIQLWDDRTILRIVALRGLSLTKFMKLVSTMGDGYLWGALAILFYGVTDVSASWLYVGLTAFAIELLFYKLIKQSTTRPRPFRANAGISNLIVPQDEYSFPSGHTAAATVAALLFSIAVPALIPFFFVLAAVIGISRIYLGVHYPSDVLMGFALGVISFTIALFLI